MERVVMRVEIDDKLSIRDNFIEIRRALCKKRIGFRGIFIETVSGIAYVWR